MKKRIISLFLVLAIITGSTTVAMAANIPSTEIDPQASWYLDSYSVTLEAVGDSIMYIDMVVYGTTTMTRLGVNKIFIEEKINGVWEEFDTVYGANNPSFYSYGTRFYVGEYSFEGTPGRDYRVTLTVYAGNSSGSDTGEITSVVDTCY